VQNGYIESFNGKFRDECLNQHWFSALIKARGSLPIGDVITTKFVRIPPAQFFATNAWHGYRGQVSRA
jgi:putative transposase